MMQRLNSSQELAYLEKPEKIEISKEEIKQKIYLPKGYRLQSIDRSAHQIFCTGISEEEY